MLPGSDSKGYLPYMSRTCSVISSRTARWYFKGIKTAYEYTSRTIIANEMRLDAGQVDRVTWSLSVRRRCVCGQAEEVTALRTCSLTAEISADTVVVHICKRYTIIIIIITGSTVLYGSWPSSKPSSILPYLMPSSSNSSLLKASYLSARVTTFRRRFCGTPSVTNPPAR
jgi:hypothetical protein